MSNSPTRPQLRRVVAAGFINPCMSFEPAKFNLLTLVIGALRIFEAVTIPPGAVIAGEQFESEGRRDRLWPEILRVCLLYHFGKAVGL